jgi:hypothetical protein
VLNPIQQFGCNSSLFLHVSFDSQGMISLLGDVNYATSFDNKRRCGAAIAGFVTCCSEARWRCVKSPPIQELSEPVRRSGILFTSTMEPDSYCHVVASSNSFLPFLFSTWYPQVSILLSKPSCRQLLFTVVVTSHP